MSELKLYACIDCDKVVKSISGLTRHTTTMHLREPSAEEKEPVWNNYYVSNKTERL